MAELKNTFTGGKMDKATDERILQNGLYRSALNVSVSPSEDSDVGAAQNILGNTRVTDIALHRTFDVTNSAFGTNGGDEFEGDNYHVASISDPQTNMIYRFIHTASASEGLWMDRIIEFNTIDATETAVFVDIFKVKQTVDIKASLCEQGVPNVVELDLTSDSKNIEQIRWGMRVEMDDMPFLVVEKVNYITKTILARQLPNDSGTYSNWNASSSVEATFLSDRNLNFGGYLGNVDTGYNLKKITGINIIDGMIFWTDNSSEPKKINIERSKMGSDFSIWNQSVYAINTSSIIDNFIHHTLLINNEGLTSEKFILTDTCGGEAPGCMDPNAANYNLLATNVNIYLGKHCEKLKKYFYIHSSKYG